MLPPPLPTRWRTMPPPDQAGHPLVRWLTDWLCPHDSSCLMRPRRIFFLFSFFFFFFENWKSIIVWLAMSDFGIKSSLAIIDIASAIELEYIVHVDCTWLSFSTGLRSAETCKRWSDSLGSACKKEGEVPKVHIIYHYSRYVACLFA